MKLSNIKQEAKDYFLRTASPFIILVFKLDSESYQFFQTSCLEDELNMLSLSSWYLTIPIFYVDRELKFHALNEIV